MPGSRKITLTLQVQSTMVASLAIAVMVATVFCNFKLAEVRHGLLDDETIQQWHFSYSPLPTHGSSSRI